MNAIRKAMQDLPGHWYKGGFNDLCGNLCGWGHLRNYTGALWNEKGVIPEAELMSKIAGEQFPERSMEQDFITGKIEPHFPHFNDHPDTTEEDVLLVMEKAAIEWEEKHGE